MVLLQNSLLLWRVRALVDATRRLKEPGSSVGRRRKEAPTKAVPYDEGEVEASQEGKEKGD